MGDSELDFRRVEPEHHDTFRAYVDYAFDPTAGPQNHDDELDRVGDGFGLFADEDLRSICVHYDFETHLRGEWVPMAGLAAVATPPEHRRRGHVRRMIDESLDRWHEEFPLAALWPFSRSYYEQFGWATANTAYEYQLPLEQLSFARGTAEGRLTRVTADDWTALNEAYEAHVAGESLGLRRDERWWRERVLDDDPYVYAWERDGETRGYVVYTFESTGDGMGDRRIDVDELAAADDDALCGLLGFLADHDSQAERVDLYAPEDTLLDRVSDPGDVVCGVHTGPMVRVVDVAHALETVPFPEDVTAELTLAVSDDTAPWNDGVFALDVAEGEGTCTRAETLEAGDADVTVDVGTLSQLVVGYRPVADLRRVGELSVASETTVETLAALFPSETVALRDFF